MYPIYVQYVLWTRFRLLHPLVTKMHLTAVVFLTINLLLFILVIVWKIVDGIVRLLRPLATRKIASWILNPSLKMERFSDFQILVLFYYRNYPNHWHDLAGDFRTLKLPLRFSNCI